MIVLANRRQKARVEVVEEIRTKFPNNRGENKNSGNEKMTTINQGAVESKRNEPKKMTYLEALKKTKTKIHVMSHTLASGNELASP